jgi:hypothetical protein
MNRLAVRRSRDVVVLDRYMAQRIEAAADGLTRVHLIPPWPHERELSPIERNQNPFRRSHALQDKLVVMYSGNHSVASPLTTLIEAALRLQNNDRLRFLFVGGGVGKREVDDAIARHQPTNIVSLPYQPLDGLRYSLAAADLHVVALGNSMAGAIHPCKVYGAMAVGRPILYLGPVPSHVADLIEQFDCGWQIDHGNVDGMCRLLEAVAALPVDELAARGERAANAIRHGLSQQVLLNRFCNVLETGRDEPSGSPPTAVAETFEISKSN